jgi:hypothetical protein
MKVELKRGIKPREWHTKDGKSYKVYDGADVPNDVHDQLVKMKIVSKPKREVKDVKE